MSSISSDSFDVLPAVLRSALYMPASNERAIAKGPVLSADAIILDLEDSVAPVAKAAARGNALDAMLNLDYGKRTRVIRCNALHTKWFDEDLMMCAKALPDAILLPKVDSPVTVIEVDKKLSQLGVDPAVQIWAMLETPMAVIAAADIAACVQSCTRLSTFCIGNNDLASDAGMQISSDRTFLIPWLMAILLAAKAYQLNVLDGVYNNFADTAGFERECAEGASMGMSGKTLIHPSQIDIANQSFSPSSEQIEQARLIVDAFALPENAQVGAVQIDGRMVERLHLEIAVRTLSLAKLVE